MTALSYPLVAAIIIGALFLAVGGDIPGLADCWPLCGVSGR